ncbi:hypothetical protein FOC4_g10000444, partial [Fusarium odoratissimum]
DLLLIDKIHPTLNILNAQQNIVKSQIIQPPLNCLIVHRVRLPDPVFCNGPKELRDRGPYVLKTAGDSRESGHQYD